MKYCQYCGAELMDGVRFCSDCGRKVTNNRKSGKNKTAHGALIVTLIALLLVFAALTGWRVWTSKHFAQDTAAIQNASGSVLCLNCYDEQGELYATGSGFVMLEDDLLVTNYHVLQGDVYRVVAQTEDGIQIEYDHIVVYDEANDVAILRTKENTALPVLKTGDSSKLRKGETVVAIGSPLGLVNTVSNGTYSGRITDDGVEYLQVSAAISSGSSGGALFNSSGEVVGITAASFTAGQNLNLAIPIERATDIWSKQYSWQNISLIELYNQSDHIPTYTVDYLLSDRLSYAHNFQNCYISGFVSSVFHNYDDSVTVYLVGEDGIINGYEYKTELSSDPLTKEGYMNAASSPDAERLTVDCVQVDVSPKITSGRIRPGAYISILGNIKRHGGTSDAVLTVTAESLEIVG